MKHVYVVQEVTCGWAQVRGVFTNRRKAQHHQELLGRNEGMVTEIHKVEVNEVYDCENAE